MHSLLFQASSPGTSLAENLEFKSYVNSTGNEPEILLHSSAHPTIDFTATEGGTYANNHLKHYVAVYDPTTNQLDITEVKNMTIRGIARQADMAEEDEAPVRPTSNYSSRNALTHTFGTKKSKKLVQSRAENVLYSRDADPDAANPLSEALLSSMPEAEALPTTSDGRILDTAAAIQAAKPLPIPDLTATHVSDAYPLSHLVFPPPSSSTLIAMPTSYWRKLISEGQRVSVSSRFTANRIAYITQAANAHPSTDSPQSTTLQLLRYILLLIELARAISKFRPGKGFPPVSKWPSGRLADQPKLPTHLLNALTSKYCPNGTGPTKFDLTLLHTTILALTLHIPPQSGKQVPGILATDPTDIQQDLNLAADDTRRYFRELGCKVEVATDKELGTWGIRKASEKAAKIKYAKLRLPLVFPQVSRGPLSGRR
jgi:DNA-directed RNA polymerase I subunit RPA49